MPEPQFSLLQPSDSSTIGTIAQWYCNEWNLPLEKSILKLRKVASSPLQFQMVMSVSGQLIGTGGIYDHVGLVDRKPHLQKYSHWLALVYTVPQERGKGYGATLCRKIEEKAQLLAIQQIHLFTDTAETLYQRLGYTRIETIELEERKVSVMSKVLKIIGSE